MIGLLVTVLIAILVYWLVISAHLPAIVAVVAAILVLLAGAGPWTPRGRWSRW